MIDFTPVAPHARRTDSRILRTLTAWSLAAAVCVATPAASSAQDSAAARAKSSRTTKSATAKSAAAKNRKPAAKKSTTTDTTRKRAGGLLGPTSGDRHLSYRDQGSDLDSLWPPKMPAQLPNAILPAKRIVAFYGNPLSTRMGILGEFAPAEMLRKLDDEVAAWNKADPQHPVQPALHLIAMVANPDPGPSGKYRTRMDSAMIEKVYGWAKSKNAVMFVDLQVGKSTLDAELPWIEKFLMRPDVHLGIDPEFAMSRVPAIPGKRVGTYDASEINYAIRFLANLVEKHKLPPKVLVVHRFTQKGLTNYKDIKLDPRVQVVIQMDGFGAPWLKRDSYYSYVKKEPVQFTGWKQFSKLKNDKPPTSREAILRLWPTPLYIQVQ
jgi:hypothetical protein